MYTLATLIACSGTGDQTTADTGSPPLDTVSLTWHPDADGDGFGSSSITVEAAEAPANHVADGTDCDDADSTVHPAATETCDGRDEDCDGDIDEDFPFSDWYIDDDGDGWGDDALVSSDCAALSGHVTVGGDCDDSDPFISPGAEEVCDDGIDDDCDGWDSRCRLEGTISLADAEARFLGESTGDTVGDFFVCGGDTNGDGFPELLIGETEQYRDDYLGELSVGGVWLVTDWEAGSHDLNEDAAVPLWGNVEGWYRGGALTFLHDPLGDGYDGVMVGSSEDNAAYIYYGPITAPILPPNADAVILNKGLGIGDRAVDFGDGSFVITNTGDLLDGSGGGQDVGKAFLFTEPPSGTIDAITAHATLAPHTDNERGYFGWSLCSSDLDGDGVKDLAIGMPAFYPSWYPDYMSGGAVY
ncbi:MAG: hypothetical protein ACI8RZ_000890, partial [Myxococcota bacterium]